MENKFTADWFSHHIPMWEMWLGGLKGLKYLDFLEIGSYEGRSSIWLLENIINDDTCNLTCIDSFIDDDYEKKNKKNLINQFLENIQPYQNKVRVFHQESFLALNSLLNSGSKFDFIYIDGSHKCIDCYLDIFFSWKLLNKGGMLIVDDYKYNIEDKIQSPFESVNQFLSENNGTYNILYNGYRIFIEKII